MEEYVQSIKNIEGKNLQEVVTDIGNKLCRGFFCEDQEDIFYRRFEKACDNAFQTAQEETNEEDKTINITNPLYRESYTACIELAEKELSAFKKVAGKEATVYHKNSIETSTNTYAEKAWEMISDLANVMGTTIKKFSVIAQHVE